VMGLPHHIVGSSTLNVDVSLKSLSGFDIPTSTGW
jgi:hypothetical protein